jgi:hypothetical protein
MTTPFLRLTGLFRGCAFALAAWLAAPAALPAAGIPEPATIIYGKIIRTDATRPSLLTEGQLNWTIRRADGVEINLQASLAPLNNREFSYRLNVPHAALSAGLTAVAGSVSLGLVDQPALHARITVNGKPAAIIGDVGAVFNVSQIRRAATHRLDLIVSLEAPDTDGNGLPDWWEQLYTQSNPGADTDGDGWNNLTEFRNGSDPTKDNRLPTLATTEVQVYAEGMSAIRLRSVDSDSPAANLTYTLDTPPVGTLLLRNVYAVGPGLPGAPKNTDRPLGAGATFTQADVDQGRLVYMSSSAGQAAEPVRFEVSLRDEDPTHAAFRGAVTLHLFRPSVTLSAEQVAQVLPGLPGQLPAVPGLPAEEQALTANYLMGRNQGFLVTDVRREMGGVKVSQPSSGLSAADYSAQYVARYGADRRHLVIGGPGADELAGGMEADVLAGNGGRDVLRGGGGADVFLFTSGAGGGSVIEDFSLAEQDVIDVGRLLAGSSTFLADYVRVTTDGTNSLVGISINGAGGAYADYVITVRGTALAQTDLYALVEAGRLRAGNKGLIPLVTIAATQPVASETGPQAGQLVIRRAGDISAEAQINLQLTGSAQNGVDYRLISTPVRIPAGQSSVTVAVEPVADGLTEGNETVEAIVLAGSGYVLGAATRAVVTLEDLAVQLRIEAIEPVAVVAGGRTGAFLITRSGITDRSVLVRLDVKGTAANFTDYEGIASFVNLAPNQTTAIISVVPKVGAVLADGTEYVQLGLKPDAAYVIAPPAEARVSIVYERTTLTDWRLRNFPSVGGALADFGRADTGGHGINNLQRYAFGLDPANPRGSKGIPAFRVVEGRLTVDFRKPAWVPDVQYVVEVSDDLITWQSSTNHVEPAVPAGGGDADTASYQAKRAPGDPRPTFMRVRVVHTP